MERPIKALALIILLILNSFTISGCLNTTEINNRAIVAGVALDKNKENNKYILTIEFILSKKTEKEVKFQSEITSMEGDSVLDATKNFISQTGLPLYWAHVKALIISQDIAKEGLLQILDMVGRNAQVSHDMWVMISREETAGMIFKEGKPKMHDTISYFLNDTFKAKREVSSNYAVSLWSIMKTLSCKEISPVLPAIKLSHGKIPEVDGCAVFKKDKLVDWVDRIETRSLLFIINKLEGGVIVLQNVADSTTNVTLDIFDCKTRIEPMSENNNAVMNINVKMSANIAELSDNKDFISKDGRNKLKKDAQELIKKQIKTLIEKGQNEFNSDIFGFGGVIKRKMPKVWKEVETDWDKVFSSLKYQINVEVDIKGSALKSKPTKVGA